MAIGEKLKESARSFSSSTTSTTSSSTSILFQSISSELDGLKACPPTCANSSESNPFSLPKWESWWRSFRPKTANMSCVHQHHHQPRHHQWSEDGHSHQQRLPRLNSLPLHLTVVLLVATLFASFPNPVGSAISEENERLVCVEGISSGLPGATFPRGDIFLKEGDTLQVWCKLNLTNPDAKGYNASNIDFVFTKADIHGEQVVKSVINETTAVVRVKNMNASNPFLQCVLRRRESQSPITVCQNEIEVGFPPLPVEDFRCVARDWRSLNCSWKLPINPIPTKYSLVKIWKRYSPIACPNETATPTSCTWGPRTEPHYMQNIDPINLRLNGTNALMPSGVTWDYSFTLGSIVIPEKPEIHVIKKSSVLYTLNWTFPNYEHFKPGLLHQLSICSEYEEKCNVTILQTNLEGPRMTPYYITDAVLPYANTAYTIKVRLRSPGTTNNSEEFWSDPDTYILTTDAKAPLHPPKTDMGSFESNLKLHNTRDIDIYWKSIAEKFKNGPGFKYHIDVFENKKETNITALVITDSYAKFTRLHPDNSYHFYVSAVNARGKSGNVSEIIVPSTKKLPEGPKSVSKIDFTNGSFEISWKRPDRYEGIVSYTVFRCVSKKPHPYPCEGPMEWDRVETSSLESMYKFYNFGLTHSEYLYQFAVSANTERIASGMVWAGCTLIHNKVPGKLRNVHFEDPSEDEILIKWDLECSYQSGDIEGFKITYCQVETHPAERCKDDESSVAVEGANVTTYRLVKLKPYSFYKIYVSILSGAGQSKRSEPVYARTSEGAPSHAHIERISQVTNVSATLHIQSPVHWNGQLREYKLYYRSKADADDREHELRVPLQVSNETISFTEEVTLKNLTSNSNYSVFLITCTSKCSSRSEGFFLVTDIGRTDLNTYPTMVVKSGRIVISWWKPERFGGPIDHFQIMLESNGKKLSDENEYPTMDFSSNTEQYHAELEHSCEPGTNFTAQIRAVTKLANGQYLNGAWSPPGNYNCGGGIGWMVWMILVFVLIAGFTFFGYLAVRFYHYLRHMKEVPIKLPPGLNSELNGFTHKPPPRGRSNDQSTNFSYPLQPTSSQGDESKDFLSSTDLNQGEAEESLIEKPFCPSPTNPLLGGLDVSANGDVCNLDDDEQCNLDDIRLTDFNQICADRCSSPSYKKLGVLSNGSIMSTEPTPGPSTRSSPAHSSVDVSSLPSHLLNQISNHHPIPTSLKLEPSTSNGINRTVPDVLSSSPSTPSSLNSISLPAQAPAPLPPQVPPPSSSYVKWTTLVPDMKTGDVGLDNSSRQSPYCQVGILLDS